MKQTILILITTLIFFSCKEKKPEFHLIVHVISVSPKIMYGISFTNDNWETGTYLYVLDGSKWRENYSTESCQEAQQYAKKFNSYEKCIANNQFIQSQENEHLAFIKQMEHLDSINAASKTLECPKQIEIY